MIPFVDLKAQYASVRGDVNAAIQGVLESGQFTLGSEVSRFEEEFAAYCGTRFGIGVNTGTSALHLALLAADVGPGDEVITVPFTFVATVAAIRYTGATPVFVDVDPDTLTMDPAALAAAVTSRTKAVIPVHLYGQTAEMDAIVAVARRHGLAVVEDACQAHGAEYRGRRAGSIGHLGCFSFYPGKNLGAYGEGGMVVTDDVTFARRIRMLRDWGAEQKYRHEIKGYNYRLETLQAAVLRVKLRRLEEWTELRRAAAARYETLLAPLGIRRPVAAANRRHVYHIYAVRTRMRERWMAALSARGIQTGIHYPVPAHLLPAHADLGYVRGAFVHSERAADEVLSLPMYAELDAEQTTEVAAALRELAADERVVERCALDERSTDAARFDARDEAPGVGARERRQRA